MYQSFSLQSSTDNGAPASGAGDVTPPRAVLKALAGGASTCNTGDSSSTSSAAVTTTAEELAGTDRGLKYDDWTIRPVQRT